MTADEHGPIEIAQLVILEKHPPQWAGETVDGHPVYIRYHFGGLRVDVAGEPVWFEMVGSAASQRLDVEDLRGFLEPDFVLPSQVLDPTEAN